MKSALAGRVALVTGGGGGIGAATALVMAREGATVAVLDLDGEAAEASAELVRGSGGVAAAYDCDVSDPDQVGAVFGDAAERFGVPDILFNNAGISGPESSAPETPIDEFDRCVAVNLRGPFICASECIRRLRAAGKPGAIVNTASVNAVFAEPEFPAYVATKGAVAALTRALALDHAREGIRVNCVCPGYVETPMTTQFFDSADRATVAAAVGVHAVNRFAKPEEIAEVVAFLCSDAASFVVGASVLVDGGMSIGTRVLPASG